MNKKIIKGLAILGCATLLLLGDSCNFNETSELNSSENTSSENTSSENTSSENTSSENSSENSSEDTPKEEAKVIYTTGFEATDGFAAGTSYNNKTERITGPENYQWGFVFGTPTTTKAEVINGTQSVQMRYYPNNVYIGTATTKFKFEKATSLSFNAKSTGNNNVKVEISTDGTTWTNSEVFTLSSSVQTKTYTISQTGLDVYVKFSLVYGGASSTSKLTIDDVEVKGYGEEISSGNSQGNKETNPDDGGLTSSDLSAIQSTVNSYYSSVNSMATGNTLLQELTDATVPNQLTSYGDLRYAKGIEGSIGGNLNTDYDTSNPNNMIDFYSGATFIGAWDQGNTWNREHVWCQSHGWWGEVSNSKRNAGSDLHHLRPAIKSINSSRNNSLFGEATDKSTQAKYYSLEKGANATATDEGAILYGYIDSTVDPKLSTPSQNEGVFEPTDRVKGDVARIIMYMLVRYDGEHTPVTDIIYTPSRSESAALALLLKWHKEDPVSNFEIRRNNETYKIQGNRNPFIDNDNYASLIWE